MKYLAVIEQGPENFSAYLPDVPGCVATGHTVEETLRLLGEALDLHLRGLMEDGLPVPAPSSLGEYIELAPRQAAG